MELAIGYPDEKSLTIEFDDIERFDMQVAEELMDCPDEVLAHAAQSLHEMSLPGGGELTGAFVRIQHLPGLTAIRDIRSANINKLIAVTGLIKKATEVRPRLANAAFRCARCGHVMTVSQEDRYVEPFECESDDCGRKGPFTLVRELSEFTDFQKIRIQDSPMKSVRASSRRRWMSW